MAGFFRHFWALSLKNFINWYRTWPGSILEILLPVVIMYLVSVSHNMKSPVNNGLQQFLNLASVQYPVTQPVGIRWMASQNMSQNMTDFLQFANITNNTYDFYRRNPGFFWPEHCYGRGSSNPLYTNIYGVPTENDKLAPRRNFTSIGYVESNN